MNFQKQILETKCMPLLDYILPLDYMYIQLLTAADKCTLNV